jgi:hypothetical protein
VSRRLEPVPPAERSFWQLLPRRNFQRALFLVLLLAGVLFLRHSGGLSFGKLFDGFAPTSTSTSTPASKSPEFQRLKVEVQR